MRRFKSVYTIPLLVLVSFFAGVRPAYAFSHQCLPFVGGDCGWNPLNWIGDVLGAIGAAALMAVAWFINLLIGAVTWVVFQLVGFLIDFAISINTGITESEVIRFGYEQVLLVANLGIVVAIIAVAFLVMLRRPDANKSLIRLIIVALLINFGYYGVGVVIEPVNDITRLIHEASNFGPTTFAGAFTVDPDAFFSVFDQVGNTDNANVNPYAYQEGDDQNARIPGFAASAFITLASIGFSTAFLVLGTFALLIFAALLFVRYIALGLLIILLPIAWLSWAFPQLKIPGGHPWSIWWENFIRWLLFAPISLFFFYLSIVQVDNPSGALPSNDELSYLSDAGSVIGDMIIVIGLLIGGVIVANKMSITGAGYAMGLAKKAGVNIRGKLADKAKLEYNEVKQRFLNKEGVKKRLEGLSSIGSERGRMGRIVTAPVRGAGAGAMGAAQRGESGIREYYKKQYKDWAPYRIKALLDNKNISDSKRAALQSIMDEKDSTWETNIGQHLGDIYERGVVAKTGSQKDQIGWFKEGLDPRIVAAIDRGESSAAIGALMRARFDKLQTKDLLAKGDSILADWDPDTDHYKLGEKRHDGLRDAFLDYLTYDRPDAFTSVRGRQIRGGKQNLNRAVGRRKREDNFARVTLGIKDKKDRVAYVNRRWDEPNGIKASEIKWRTEAIDEIKDTKFTADDRAREKARIATEIETQGPDGYLSDLHELENSQKAMEALVYERVQEESAGTGGGGEAT